MTFVSIYLIILGYGVLMLGCGIYLRKWINNRNDMKFMKHLKIVHPDGSVITLSTVESSDEAALKTLKEQLDVR